jgi:hypothetical protein
MKVMQTVGFVRRAAAAAPGDSTGSTERMGSLRRSESRSVMFCSILLEAEPAAG